jgi:hypothetical protein
MRHYRSRPVLYMDRAAVQKKGLAGLCGATDDVVNDNDHDDEHDDDGAYYNNQGDHEHDYNPCRLP